MNRHLSTDHPEKRYGEVFGASFWKALETIPKTALRLLSCPIWAGVLFCALFSSPAEETAKVAKEKILVVYYSRTGNTEFAANTIADTLNADLYEIRTAKPYPEDFRKCVVLVKKELKGKNYPPLKGTLPDTKKYDLIIIGTPNWCGTMAPPVFSFLKKVPFSGKKVALFVTYGSGKIQECEKDFRRELSGCVILDCSGFQGFSIRESKPSLLQWARRVANRK